MQYCSVLLSILFLINHSEAHLLKKLYQDTETLLNAPVGADVGERLILTPLLKEGRIEEAQEAALVNSVAFQGVVSYSAYFTVDEAFDSNIYFWFFPSADNPDEDPVVLWLNGGPGASSLTGLFEENGPFIVNSDDTISLREYSWHRNHSVIFVDQPVGVGFSTTNEGGFAQNETKVGEDMVVVLTQFFQLFPKLQNNSFFISGESYAGKYLPAIGHAILNHNPTAELKLNLQGILIGDGWTDPINQINYGPFLYNAGLVSERIKGFIDQKRDLAIEAFQAEQWVEGQNHVDEIYSMLLSASKVNLYNYIKNYDTSYWAQLLTTEEYRIALHVGDTVFGDKGAATALEEDIAQSIAPWLEELLEHYRVLIYTGQVDVICGYPMALDYLKTLNYTGASELDASSRLVWYVDNDVAGYVRTGGNLVELMVRDAGHMVPKDQPKWAYDMLYRFVRNQSFSSLWV